MSLFTEIGNLSKEQRCRTTLTFNEANEIWIDIADYASPREDFIVVSSNWSDERILENIRNLVNTVKRKEIKEIF